VKVQPGQTEYFRKDLAVLEMQHGAKADVDGEGSPTYHRALSFVFMSPLCVSRPEECTRPFPLHPCLVSPDSELVFLRCVARILLLCLLPRKDAKSHTLRCCLTEVITTKGTARARRRIWQLVNTPKADVFLFFPASSSLLNFLFKADNFLFCLT